MTSSKRRKESAWKSRKQAQHPHGPITSLHDLARQDDAGNASGQETPPSAE
ncbi:MULTISPECIES: DUF6254 family protein [Cohnella]|uniref:DUF6254 family protein n=1 Tax=Cohnella TaxID=329857 RepID=UPI0015931E1D|nr:MULTISPECIES: DUF6254 family protein [Cohnella]MBN2983875.1 hypothetical protein [Cohnella algarum]